MGLVCWLSGPERTRARAELALEDAGLLIFPPKGFPIHRESYRAEHCRHLTPLRMQWDPETEEFVAPEGTDPGEEHGFVAVLATNDSGMSVAAAVVEKHGWVLRLHYAMPTEPEPDPVETLLQRVALLEQRLGVS